MSKYTEEEYINAAICTAGEDLDFDHKAVVSMGDDDGAYVQVWLWIPDSLVETIREDTCGHSACSQHYIDTGERNCIQDTTA